MCWQKEEGLFDLLIQLNPDHKIVESNYSNNNISGTLYVCSKSSILIIDDCDTDAHSTDEPGSADEFETVLLKWLLHGHLERNRERYTDHRVSEPV